MTHRGIVFRHQAPRSRRPADQGPNDFSWALVNGLLNLSKVYFVAPVIRFRRKFSRPSGFDDCSRSGSIPIVTFFIEFLLVAIGGSIGAMLRVLLTVGASVHFKVPFWTGIMAVNIVGCLLIGAAAAVLTASNADELWLVQTMQTMMGGSSGGLHGVELLLLTGVLGGFTTFSTAMLDIWVLWRSGHFTKAMISLFGTPLAAILALSFGLWIGGGG